VHLYVFSTGCGPEESGHDQQKIIRRLTGTEGIKRNDTGVGNLLINDIPLPPPFIRIQGFLLKLSTRNEPVALEASGGGEHQARNGKDILYVPSLWFHCDFGTYLDARD